MRELCCVYGRPGLARSVHLWRNIVFAKEPRGRQTDEEVAGVSA